MRQAKLYFDQNIDEINRIGAMYSYIHCTYNIHDLNELGYLLRTQLVNTVSALDCFIHNIVKKGIIKLYTSGGIFPPKLKNFHIPIEVHTKIVSIISYGRSYIPITPEDTIDYWIDREITHQHKFLSFQTPEKICDALSYIWLEDHKLQKICEQIPSLPGSNINEKERFLKQSITLLIDRRNQIVHEADYDPILDSKRHIEMPEVETNIRLVINLVDAIYTLLSPLYPTIT